MATMQAVVGEEMKMVPGNTECTRKTGGPQTDQKPSISLNPNSAWTWATSTNRS
jgi:hypothetical protein